MDTPFYERLPGQVTILHCIRLPALPDQKIKFPDGKEKTVAAGATACRSNTISSMTSAITLDPLTKFRNLHSLLWSACI